MAVDKKEIYLASSLKELNEKDKNIKIVKADQLLKSAQALFIGAHDSDKKEKDEEKAYVLYMRYVTVCYRQRDLNQAVDLKKMKIAITRMEELAKSLEKRYTFKKRENITEINTNGIIIDSIVSSKSENETNNGLFINGTRISPAMKSDKLKVPEKIIPKESITSTQLYKMLYEDNENVVVFDVRLTVDYLKSHMKHSSCCNVPEDILRPGMTAAAIEKLLADSSLGNWKKRCLVDYVVILDWNSSSDTIEIKSPIHILKEAFKFTSNDFLKSDPFILENGYEDWLLHYPSETTNPRLSKNKNLLNTTSAVLISVDYPEFILSDPVDELSSNIETLNLSPNVEQLKQNLDSNDDGFKRKSEISAHTPRFDRTVKPTPKPAWPSKKPTEDEVKRVNDSDLHLETMIDEQISNTINRLKQEKEFAHLCAKRENEANEEMKKVMLEEAEKVLETIKNLEEENKNLEEGRSLLEEENRKLKEQLSAKNENIEDDSLLMKEMLNRKLMEKKMRDAEVEKLRNERKRKEGEEKSRLETEKVKKPAEPKPINIIRKNDVIESSRSVETNSEYMSPLKDEPIVAKRGLSRSHSSPNIAQLVDGEEKFGRNQLNTPVVNRQVKPVNLNQSIPSVNRILKPQETSVVRQRNFNPVYSSQGNSHTGLRNLGNTCFMNSVIQCLANTSILVNYLLYQNYEKDVRHGSKGEVVQELSILIDNLIGKNCRSITPLDFKNTVSRYLKICIGNEQQDAHEFLTKLMEKLHSEINTGDITDKSTPPETDKMPIREGSSKFWRWHISKNLSAVTSIFEGLLLSQLTCLFCRSVSNSYEVFSCLSVPIPSSSRCSLNECLRSFLKTERIGGDAGWNCPTCKQKREAEKQMLIVQLPKVLVIHLKRFSYEGMWRSKLKTMVDFPLTRLDMSPYFANGCSSTESKYSLFGVVNHFGTLEGGHYISVCKSPDKWFKYDDQDVSEISSSSVVTDAAYIMFFDLVPTAS